MSGIARYSPVKQNTLFKCGCSNASVQVARVAFCIIGRFQMRVIVQVVRGIVSSNGNMTMTYNLFKWMSIFLLTMGIGVCNIYMGIEIMNFGIIPKFT